MGIFEKNRAILELKQIQCANEINFAVHVIPPVLYLSYVFMMGVRACFKQMNAWFKQVNNLFLFPQVALKPKAFSLYAIW